MCIRVSVCSLLTVTQNIQDYDAGREQLLMCKTVEHSVHGHYRLLLTQNNLIISDQISVMKFSNSFW